MSEFQTHFRKDVKLLTSDTLFIFLLVLLGVLSFFIAVTTCTSYVWSMTGGSSVVTQHALELAQKSALVNYWSSVGNIFMVLFLAAAAMAISVEKESGMSRYILTFRARKPAFYLSKLLLLMILVAIALVIALVVYLVVFSFMDVPMLDASSLAASMLFPALGMMVFATLGLALSTFATKKGAVIALAVVVYMALTILSSFSIAMGSQAVYRDHPTAGPNNLTEFMPLEYKLLIYGNPIIISQGTSAILDANSGSWHPFDAGGGVVLSVAFFIVFLVLGLLSFSRERMEHSWLTTVKGIRKRA